MRSLISLIRGERRNDEREPIHRTVHIFLAGQHVGEARLLNESEGGARIGLVNGAPPPQGSVLLDVETAHAHEFEVAWARGEEVGLRYLSAQRLRGYVSPQYQPLKDFWETAAVLIDPR